MTVLYSLAAGQLSKQYHYDFKLRALKSVLVMAGDLKRGSPGLSEEVVLMRALRDMNLPKFVAEDVPLFKGLLSDLFPGLDCPRVGYPALRTAIEAELEQQGMRHQYKSLFDQQCDKVMQLYETMLTRHTTMVVGRTLSGKSVVINTLAAAQKRAFDLPTKLFVLNPKAITVNELYGVLDPNTRDWTDGLLSKIFRDINQPVEKAERRYIVADGDVDAVWVENLNSVMDDNKLLTLTNGERIRLEKHCAFLLEVYDLQYASPATISRCGMVYLDDKNLGPGPYFDKWARGKRSITDKHADLLEDIYDKYIPASVALVFEGKETVAGMAQLGEPLESMLPRSLMGTDGVIQLCTLFDALCLQLTDKESGKVNLPIDMVENMFIFCLIWSIGSVLTDSARQRFDEFVRRLASNRPLPRNGSLYDSVFEVAEGGRWVTWEEKVPSYVAVPGGEFARILVPTVDTTRYSWLRKQFSSLGASALFVGESGTAKTVTIGKSLSDEDVSQSVVLNVNFSSRTSSLDFQRNIEDAVVKRTGRIFGPEGGRKLRVFIDDLNMPKIDKYGTQQPLALVKFLVERGFMYERGTKELDKIIIKDTEYIAAMQPPGGGRNSIDPRVAALFCCIGVTFPSANSIDRIYATITKEKFSHFAEPVFSAASQLPAATLQLHKAVVDNLIRSPTRFHYIFNLRDLSRVYQGLWQCDPSAIKTPTQLVRLWRNECVRVYSDRLLDKTDKDFVGGNQLPGIVRERFGGLANEVMADPLLFGDFRDVLDHITRSDNPLAEKRLYEDLGGSWDGVKGVLEGLLENYNLERKPVMNLVMFIDAMEHIMRVHRIIRQPRGNAFLIGIGGSGRQSFARFASYMACYSLFEVTLSRGYGDALFRDDLRKLYALAVKKPVSFLFTDAHVVEEGFLEYINNLLTVGMVPALFSDDEKEALMGGLRAKATKAGIPESLLWAYTVDHVRNQLHIILAMSPAGDNLRVRCRSFPGLVGSTTIDWFFPWPKDALIAVARHILAPISVPEEHRAAINEHICDVHLSVTQKFSVEFENKLKRKTFATPKNFLDYLGNYGDLLAEFRKVNDGMQARLGGGLLKLTEAAAQVKVMSVELADKKVIVDANAASVAALIDKISEKSAIVEKRQAEANETREGIEKDSVVIEAEKAEADVALAAALPALEAAAKALEGLDKKDITEVKSMASPPPAVATVCTMVMILKPLGKEDESSGWAGAKAMLSDVGLLKALFDYPKDQMKDRQVKRIKQIMAEEGETFEGDNMLKISKAGAGLLQWVKAMVKYHEIARTVEPKKKLVQELSDKKAIAEKNLAKINAELAELAAQIGTLKADEQEQSAKLRILTEEADAMQRRLRAASTLIEGLGSEQVRWTADLEQMGVSKARLVGDCLLSASFLSYVGPFTFEFRKAMVYDSWQSDLSSKAIPLTQPFRLETLLVPDVEVSKWNSQGLPADELSVQNGVLTTRSSRRWPLCVDPQMQAVNWIKKKEEGRLSVKSFNDDYIKHLELAVQYGKAFLFADVEEELDPMIDSVLEKNTTIVNGQRMIKLGDSTVEWNENFCLFLTTKIANPRYTPEVMGKVSLINYTVTLDGLAAQLLNVVVGFERPDLESERVQLVQSMNENRQILKGLEDSLLKELASSKGSLLDNDDLIQTLQTTKSKATEIAEALHVAKKTAEELEKLRNTYQKVAKRGAILYFAMQGLSQVSEMYEYSLGSYLGVFETALREAEADSVVDERLKKMQKKLTENVYDYTCLSIFERHKLLFSFRVTSMIMEGDGDLVGNELDFFIKGNTQVGKPSKPKPEWLSEASWKDLLMLSTLGSSAVLATLPDSVLSNEIEWRHWADLESPESVPLPLGISVTPFQSLLILRCFRVDRVVNAVKLFIMNRLGEYYVQPPFLNYDRIYAQSSERAPVVFVLSPGADPQSDVQKLGERLGFVGNKFRFLALGQGMGPVAQQAIEQGCQKGHWVMLQNCHLLVSWLKTLERILDTIASRPHKDFRLWLTTMPTPAFPLGVLQRALKIVTEPSEGLKLNLRGSYAKIAQEELDSCSHSAFPSLVFSLAFFHAVIQDRRKFGRIGWNVSYDFNESDFRVSFRLLNLYLGKSSDDIPWTTLRYLIGEAMYGGRVSDECDRRVLSTYLRGYMGGHLFEDGFCFSKSGFDYTLPQPADIKSVDSHISAIPLTQSPAVFGLHANAEINYLSNNSKALWRGLLAMGGGGGGSEEEGGGRETRIATIGNDILKRISEQPELKYLAESTEQGLSPTEVVLTQEIERYNKLTSLMISSLSDLGKALKGEIGMSQELDEVGSCLFNGILPHQWKRLAPDSDKPLASWMDHFSKRFAQYNEWVQTRSMPKVVWLSGLHIPESLLSALVQTTCRAKQWALDKSSTFTEVTSFTDASEISAPLEFGTYVQGLYLEGADWDIARGHLTLQKPKQLVMPLPLMRIVPIESDDPRMKDAELLQTPVYVTQARRNAMGVGLCFEGSLRMAAGESKDMWILQGVAMFLNIDT